MQRRLTLLFVVLLCSLVQPGCTRTLLLQGYKNADVFIYMRANRYFSLDGDQVPLVKGKIKEQLMWHRSAELPNAADFFTALEPRTVDGLSREDLTWLRSSVIQMRDRTLLHIEPDVSLFLSNLKPEQIKICRKEFDKDSGEILKEIALPEPDKVKIRAKRLTDIIELWTGSLSADQKNRVREIATGLPDAAPTRMAYRFRFMNALESMSAKKAPLSSYQSFLKSYWLISSDHDATAAAYSNLTWDSFNKAMIQIDPVLTSQQRSDAARNFREFGQDLREISRSK